MADKCDKIVALVNEGKFAEILHSDQFVDLLALYSVENSEFFVKRVALAYRVSTAIGFPFIAAAFTDTYDVCAQLIRCFFFEHLGSVGYELVFGPHFLDVLANNEDGSYVAQIVGLFDSFPTLKSQLRRIFLLHYRWFDSYFTDVAAIGTIVSDYVKGKEFESYGPYDPFFVPSLSFINFSFSVEEVLAVDEVETYASCVMDYRAFNNITNGGYLEHHHSCCAGDLRIAATLLAGVKFDCNGVSRPGHFCCLRGIGNIKSEVKPLVLGEESTKALVRSLDHSCVTICRFLKENRSGVDCVGKQNHISLCCFSSSSLGCSTFCCKCNVATANKVLMSLYRANFPLQFNKRFSTGEEVSAQAIVEKVDSVSEVSGSVTTVAVAVAQVLEKTNKIIEGFNINSGYMNDVDSYGFKKFNDGEDYGYRKNAIWCINWSNLELEKVVNKFLLDNSENGIKCNSWRLYMLQVLNTYQHYKVGMAQLHSDCDQCCSIKIDKARLNGLWFVVIANVTDIPDSYIYSRKVILNDENSFMQDLFAAKTGQEAIEIYNGMHRDFCDRKTLRVIVLREFEEFTRPCNTLVVTSELMDLHATNIEKHMRFLLHSIVNGYYHIVRSDIQFSIDVYRPQFKLIRDNNDSDFK
jgi:hypothetical protein